ncbi:transcription regulatory protein SNF5, putative (BSH) isoform X2 [Tasmannia lanceolata]
MNSLPKPPRLISSQYRSKLVLGLRGKTGTNAKRKFETRESMRSFPPTVSKLPIKFRIPTAENLVPIRLDIEIDGQRFKDAFTWNPSDPDTEVVAFAKRTVKDLKLPHAFTIQIAQSIQNQLTEFRSYEGQEMYTGEKLVPLKLDLRVNRTVIRDQFLWDLNNFESDPEEFARTFCRDLDIGDPEVGPAIAVAIREQLYELAIQNVASARETRIGKKGRRGTEYVTTSKPGGSALDLMKLFGNKASVIRKRKEWDVYEPIIDILSTEEVETLESREERNAR